MLESNVSLLEGHGFTVFISDRLANGDGSLLVRVL